VHHISFVAYYKLGARERLIVDNLVATVGTDVNWRMIETVITKVNKLEVYGHVCINRWDKFMAHEAKFQIGHKVLMILHLGDHGIYLFVSYVSDVPLDE
jgi:hypothetical protein